MEPAASPVLEGGEAAPHRIQGIGANFIPKLYDASVVDEVISVPDDEAIRAGRGSICGPFVGGTSRIQEQKNRSVVT